MPSAENFSHPGLCHVSIPRQQHQPSLGLSWMGTSCLDEKDAERELAALRAKPMLQKKARARKSPVPPPMTTPRIRQDDEYASQPGAPPHQGRSWAPLPATGHTSPPTGTQFHGGSPSSWLGGKLTTYHAVEALQVEVKALHQALLSGDSNRKPEYMRAQMSMSRLDHLEGVLWEAHDREARAKAIAETQQMQLLQKAEITALEANLRQRRDRLELSCSEQVRSLRQAHEAQLAGLDRKVASDVALRGVKSDSKGGKPWPLMAKAQAAFPMTRLMTPTVYERPPSVCDTIEGGGGVDHGDISSLPIVYPLQVETATSGVETRARDPSTNKKALIELRDELERQLAAVPHAFDRGGQLQKATRVMREIEKLEALDRVEAEARGGLGSIIEISTLQQKQAHAEEIQGDKHERLRRNHECSGAEELHLLSARHRRALGRLTVRCRAEKRQRQVELREKLALVKGDVARVWREHNRSRCHGSSRSGRQRSRHGGDAGDTACQKSTKIKNDDDMFPYSKSAWASARPHDNARSRSHDQKLDSKPVGDVREERKQGIGVEEKRGNGVGRGGRGRRMSTTEHRSITFESTASPRPLPATVDAPAEQVVKTSKTAFFSASKSRNHRLNQSRGSSQSSRLPNPTPTPGATVRMPAARNKSRGHKKLSVRSKSKRMATSTVATTITPTKIAQVGSEPAVGASDRTHLATDGGTGSTPGPFGVLTEEEAHALAALGKGAPHDPHLLLLASPPLPPRPRSRRQQSESPSSPRQGFLCEASTSKPKARGDDLQSCDRIAGGDGRSRMINGDVCGEGAMIGEYLDDVLERAADKLARKIEAEEALARRHLGTSSRSR